MRLPRKRRQQFITVFSVRTTHHNWLGKFTLCPKHEFRSKLIEIFSIISTKNYQFCSFQSKMSKYFKSEFNLLLLIVFINNWPMVTIWYQTHLWRTSPRTLFVRLTVRSRFYRRTRSQSFLHVYLCFGKKFEPLVGYMYLMYRQFLETVSRSLSKKMSNLSQRAIKSKTGFLIVEL